MSDDIGPSGQWQCDRCGFCLTSSVLNVNSGTMSADQRARQVCPNDGSDLRRVTWREYSAGQEAGIKRLMTLLDEREAEIARLAAPVLPSATTEQLTEIADEIRYVATSWNIGDERRFQMNDLARRVRALASGSALEGMGAEHRKSPCPDGKTADESVVAPPSLSAPSATEATRVL